ncbi:polyamine aminopropyltransferase [Tumebacillus sp. DT12]|uniref:Polyamine aminopropyltransferase n=1 Tax=Tumebacillus lacus TaxID=2995335 RepID=A0ABT3WYB3_9BACL|nr:polyamine aminopropyltransferase [Tumebacillus lacus]MCX7569657.1 polyamine aminopropyltransferase [Tumebacillus lacus]
MELWYTEKQTENYGITAKIENTIHTEQSEFQRIDLIETLQWGKMLVLDGMVMTTDKDEFVYHEMITHLAMNTHPNPKQVLVVGGGDGGAIREILKYPSVERAVLAEIDGRVIEVSKQYLPEIAGKLDDPRVDVQVVDGIQYIHDNKNTFDVILVDSTEPVGPAVGLFARDFYQGIYESLKEDGIMVAQTESPFFNADLITRVFKDIASIYPVTRYYTGSIPTYPSGLWSWTMGSKKYDPLEVDEAKLIEPEGTKYYHKAMHKTVFTVPKFVQELLK